MLEGFLKLPIQKKLQKCPSKLISNFDYNNQNRKCLKPSMEAFNEVVGSPKISISI